MFQASHSGPLGLCRAALTDPLHSIPAPLIAELDLDLHAGLKKVIQTLQRCPAETDVMRFGINDERTSAGIRAADSNRKRNGDALFAAAPHQASHKMRLGKRCHLIQRGDYRLEGVPMRVKRR